MRWVRNFLFLLFVVGAPSELSAEKISIDHSELIKILVLGDSLTEGYGVAKEDSFPSQLENELKENYPKIKVISAGSSGSTSASAYKRLKWHLKSKPQILILALGANDGLRGISPQTTKENLKKTIQLAKENRIEVVLAGMQMPYNYGEEYRKSYAKTFTDLSQELKLNTIPFLLEGVGGIKEMNLADGIHPNEKGHKKIARNISRKLQSVIKINDQKSLKGNNDKPKKE